MRINALFSEHTSWWQTAGLCAIFTAALLPALPLLSGLSSAEVLRPVLVNFLPLLVKSIGLNLAGAALALISGLITGITHTLYSFPGKRLIQTAFILPLATPPLLWAQGLRNYDIWLFQGAPGIIFITALVTFPLVMLVTVSSCSLLTSCQCDAARLSGGEPNLLRNAVRFCMPSATLASILGACIMLSSPGPAMALGTKSASSEILVSFSALYNTGLAATQCALMSVAVFFIVLLSFFITGNRPLEALSTAAEEIKPRRGKTISAVCLASAVLLISIFLALPAGGLITPALSRLDITATTQTISRTAANTIVYATGSAATATLVGTIAAFLMGKSGRYRVSATCAMLLIFSLPAALPALGLVTAGAGAPPWLDLIFRSRAAVCISQGLRLFPVSAILISRALSSIPSSWSWAAELHGIPLKTYVTKVILPIAARPMGAGFLLIFLLSQADVATVLLLHPPGSQNLPLAIFTIMANAPKALIAQLDLIYMAFAATLLFILLATIKRKGDR